MQTEAVPTKTSSESTGTTIKDPMLLGVSLPLNMTVAAATQVKNAWAEALSAVIAAAKAKANAAKAKGNGSSNGSGQVSA